MLRIFGIPPFLTTFFGIPSALFVGSPLNEIYSVVFPVSKSYICTFGVKDRVMECWQTLELRHVLTQERFRDGNFMSSSTIAKVPKV
ncbi:hypothetical protein PNOK_0872300 [Pyrrhoderma noxium]|uniref:Uncharacterized protein n=1 Tax=Pyrrhoderma noxium TaxID=2282107 RepID=A0A286U8H9_9AGAM|nr:hypothetical protein PNOK_0872300 [Pyrrhoderma noxium]